MRLQINKLGKVAITVEKEPWDITKDYDKLVIVLVKDKFATYISRKPVPAGTMVTDTEYWIPFSTLKEEILLDYNKILSDLDNYKTTIESIEANIQSVLDSCDTSKQEAYVALIECRKILKEVTDIKNSITDSSSLASKVDALEEQIRTNTASWESSFQELETAIGVINQTLATHATNINDITSKVNLVEQNIILLQKEITSINNSINTLAEKVKKNVLEIQLSNTTVYFSKYDRTVNIKFKVKGHGNVKSTCIAEVWIDGGSYAQYGPVNIDGDVFEINDLLVPLLNTGKDELLIKLAVFDEDIITTDTNVATEYILAIKNNKPNTLDHACYIINQDNSVTNPAEKVTPTFVKNYANELIYVSDSGVKGNSDSNFLTWLREHTHAYVGVYDSTMNDMQLKQLDDNVAGKFADGTDATSYLSTSDVHTNIWMKFDVHIYFKTEKYKPESGVDKVLVTIANNKLDDGNWERVDKDTLIGVYEASTTEIDDVPYLRSTQKAPVWNATSEKPFDVYIYTALFASSIYTIIEYKIHQLMALLFYGYYASLDSQSICGYGTQTYDSTDNAFYPKHTCIDGSAPMIDTNSTTGTGNVSDRDTIIAGTSTNLKSIRFWGLENWWGNVAEVMLHSIYGMVNPTDTPNSDLYLDDHIDAQYFKKALVTINGVDEEMTTVDDGYLGAFAIAVNNDEGGTRFICTGGSSIDGIPSKMMFGVHADMIPLDNNIGSDSTLNYSDNTSISSDKLGYLLCRGGYSNLPTGGISALSLHDKSAMSTKVGTRIMYKGGCRIVDNFN